MYGRDVKYSGEQLRAIAGINLVVETRRHLGKMRKKVEKLGMGYIRNKIHADIEYLQSIILTAANPIANDILTEKINNLDREVNDIFPYPDKVQYCILEVSEAFRVAVAKHNQEYEGKNIEAITKSLGSEKVMDSPKIYFNRSKRKQLDYIEND